MLERLVHKTLVFDRRFGGDLEALYASFESPVARSRWGLPSPSATIIYDHADFRVGGRDASRCGDRNDPAFRVEVRYIDIVPRQRIVYSETVTHKGRLLSASIYSIEMGDDGGTQVRVTVHLTSFGGQDMADDIRFGFGVALDNLERELDAPLRAE